MLLQPRRVHELLMMRRTVMAWCRDSNIEGLVLARNGASSALFFAHCVGKPGCAKDHWQTTRTYNATPYPSSCRGMRRGRGGGSLTGAAGGELAADPGGHRAGGRVLQILAAGFPRHACFGSGGVAQVSCWLACASCRCYVARERAAVITSHAPRSIEKDPARSESHVFDPGSWHFAENAQ